MTNKKLESVKYGVTMRDFVEYPLQVLSMGGGVQSTAMLFLVKDGVIPKPDLVLHSDTGSELPETMDFIKNTIRPLCSELGIPFYIVSSHRGALHDYYMSKRSLPTIGIRSCTADFKIHPQRRFVRSIVGNGRGKKLVDFWLGITVDEENRAIDKKTGERRTTSDVKWSGIKYPLLDINYSRRGCENANKRHGAVIGKSGCFMCPYMGKRSHLRVKELYPDLFDISLQMEVLQRKRMQEEGKLHRYGLCKEGFLEDIANLGEKYEEDSDCESDGGCFL